MSNPRISYAPRPGTTLEAEGSALASVYRFVLACRAKKNAAGMTSTNGDDAIVRNTEGVNHVDQRPN